MNVGVSVTVPMSVCRYDSLWYQKITPKVLGVGETEKKDFFFFLACLPLLLSVSWKNFPVSSVTSSLEEGKL